MHLLLLLPVHLIILHHHVFGLIGLVHLVVALNCSPSDVFARIFFFKELSQDVHLLETLFAHHISISMLLPLLRLIVDFINAKFDSAHIITA